MQTGGRLRREPGGLERWPLPTGAGPACLPSFLSPGLPLEAPPGRLHAGRCGLPFHHLCPLGLGPLNPALSLDLRQFLCPGPWRGVLLRPWAEAAQMGEGCLPSSTWSKREERAEGGAGGGRREPGRWQKAGRRREGGGGGIPTLSFKENDSPFRKQSPRAPGPGRCQRMGRSHLRFLPRAKYQHLLGPGGRRGGQTCPRSWQDVLFGEIEKKQINLLISMIISGGDPC